MIVVTGAAGFIGSNIVAALNDQGRNDVVVCDTLQSDGRWVNLRKRMFQDFVFPTDLFAWLDGAAKVDAIVHMGAESSTAAVDGDDVIRRNFQFSLRLLDWCTQHQVPLIYASSAATYGGGECGFDDDWSFAALRTLRPLNLYGWSKHQFDLVVSERWERHQPMPPKCIGLKFFNVYGQNEAHKADMRSVVTKLYPQVKAGEGVQLFESHRAGIAHGGQLRDFICVDDVVDVVQWCLDSGLERGIFNVGTGRARSFKDLATAVFTALGQTPQISYFPMPETLRDKYQYFTEAKMDRLRHAGYNGQMATLERGVAHYVQTFLDGADPVR